MARQLRERAEQHTETHLTLRDLRHVCWDPVPGAVVYVCENPRVVEAAADAGMDAGLVCTSGNATTVVHTLLTALVEGGTRLYVRGDFDWAGVAMVERLLTRYPAQPWRMSAADYEQQVERARDRRTPLQPLEGRPQTASWDPELAPSMNSFGMAVHEESALDLLVQDLRQRP
ncbi:DUF2399 domain-containing protein [Lipingzhangella sp. LS1_29]|uniref:DUF2399 domain-containing protein n=1 Tax=Lipingzhangella rawalii TaxID=2055835 RepID=A0ABU2H631_9ACTN|nr:DUF2399 domain-containing protein [Lipingzhangella rawalii]MDS1270741.1 DUF2399 domain-containing protein [Lipingzhangella rawalii]